MGRKAEIGFPEANADERELLLSWLGYLRGGVLRNVEGVSDHDAHRSPDGALLPLLGIVNHLTRVEWRWIDGGMRGLTVDRAEEEFHPGADLTVDAATSAYRARAEATDSYVRSASLAEPRLRESGTDLRWVLLHLLNETARHAGHADATRELLDGSRGE